MADIAAQPPASGDAAPPQRVRMTKWTPTTNLMELRRFGKTLEELCELGVVLARCIIQGIDETDPASGEVNRARLERETADVGAQLRCTIEAMGLDSVSISARIAHKMELMREWEALFDEPKAPQTADQNCLPNGVMFDTFGELRTRYVRITLDVGRSDFARFFL